MSSVGADVREVKLVKFVAHAVARGHGASVSVKLGLLQEHIDTMAAEELGRRAGEAKGAHLDGQVSRWRCSRCGSRRKGDLSYNGAYRRVFAFADGSGEVRIPRIRCRCGGNVCPDFGPVVPARRRHWHDLNLTAVELHVEGLSLRGVRRYLARRGVQVGLSSLARMLGAFAEVDINAGLGGRELEALSLDAAFWRVAGGSRAHLYAHEVRARDKPLVRGEREVAWHRTGKVVGCGLAAEESGEAWEALIGGLVADGVVDSQKAVFAATDGNQGLMAALEMELPWSIRQRCVWHIGYRTRARIIHAANREPLERDALWVFGARDVAAARGRLERFMARWHHVEPDAAESVGDKFMAGVEYLRHPERAVRPRTIAISERYNQEAKRRFRPGRSFGSERNLAAMVRLLALRHNCLIDGIDWVGYAARWLWQAPTGPPTTHQQERP